MSSLKATDLEGRVVWRAQSSTVSRRIESDGCRKGGLRIKSSVDFWSRRAHGERRATVPWIGVSAEGHDHDSRLTVLPV